MALTQSESIWTLAFEMGMADGDFTDQELEEVIYNNPVYLEYFKKIDLDLLKLKIKRGEVNKDNAVSTLKGRSLGTQLDALACVWHVLIADGVMEEGEKQLMAELLNKFDIDIDSVASRLEKMQGK